MPQRLIRAWLLVELDDQRTLVRVDDPEIFDLRVSADRTSAWLLRTVSEGAPTAGSKGHFEEFPLDKSIVVGGSRVTRLPMDNRLVLDLQPEELEEIGLSSACNRCGHLALFHNESVPGDGPCCIGDCDCDGGD